MPRSKKRPWAWYLEFVNTFMGGDSKMGIPLLDAEMVFPSNSLFIIENSL